jgi:hypothetical protein
MSLKKGLMIAGALFLSLVVVGGAVFGWTLFQGRSLDKESKAYVDAAIPAIVSTWDVAEIQKRSSPELRAAVNDERLAQLVQVFQKVGRFKSYGGSKGEATISVTQNGKAISAAYVGDADFDTGPAHITMTLVKHSDQWQILGLQVNSDALLR